MSLFLLFSNKEVFVRHLSQYLAKSHHVMNSAVIMTAVNAGAIPRC